MGKGNKFDQEKRRMDLIPITPLNDWADVLTYGSKKYEDRNWEKGIEWSRIYAAILRHLTEFWDGEDMDSESKLYHVAHAMCGCSFLLEYMRTHKELDNRPRGLDNL